MTSKYMSPHIVAEGPDDLERLALFGSLPEELEGHGPATEAWRGAVAIHDSLVTQFRKIDADQALPSSLAKATTKRVYLKGLVPKLEALGKAHDGLVRNVNDLQRKFEPAVPNDMQRTTAIWTLLPKDALTMRTTAQDAIEAGHWDVVNAIAELPVLHPGSLAVEAHAALFDARVAKENPELAKQIGAARAARDLVGPAVATAAKIVGEQVKRLGPEPEPHKPGATGFTTQDGDLINA